MNQHFYLESECNIYALCKNCYRKNYIWIQKAYDLYGYLYKLSVYKWTRHFFGMYYASKYNVGLSVMLTVDIYLLSLDSKLRLLQD